MKVFTTTDDQRKSYEIFNKTSGDIICVQAHPGLGRQHLVLTVLQTAT